MRASAVTMPRPNSARSSSTMPGSASRAHHAARMSYTRMPVLRQGSLAQRALVGGTGRRPARPWKQARKRLRLRTACASSSTSTSMTPLRAMHVARARRLGRHHAEPAAFDHRGAAHADARAARRDDMSQLPSSAALPAKQRPATMPTIGTWPDSVAQRAKRRAVQAGDDGESTSPGRPPPPSANSTTGSFRSAGELEQAIGLVVVVACPACRPAP